MLLADVYRCALEHHTLACVSIFRCAQLVCAVACNTARGFRFAAETLPGLVALYGNYMMEWQCMDFHGQYKGGVDCRCGVFSCFVCFDYLIAAMNFGTKRGAESIGGQAAAARGRN